MTQIVLNPDQVKLYHQATEPVQVCDPQGKVLGTLPPDYSAEFIAQLKRSAELRAADSPANKLRADMQALAEAWKREGPFDESAAFGNPRADPC